MRHDLAYLLAALLCCGAWIISTTHQRTVLKAVQPNQTMFLCVLITDNAALNRTVRALSSALAPPGVQVDLMVVVSPIAAPLRHQWRHGRWMMVRNVSSAHFESGACFLLIDDTVDASPFFLHWFWKMWTRHNGQLLIAGDRTGGTGVMPMRWMWRLFLRRYVANLKRGVVWPPRNMTGRFVDMFRGAAKLAVPPLIDGYTMMRAERQPLTERERVPKMARMWSEDFVTGALVY